MADQSAVLSLVIKAKNEAQGALDAAKQGIGEVGEAAKDSALETSKTQAAIDALGKTAESVAAMMAASFATMKGSSDALNEAIAINVASMKEVVPTAAANEKAAEDFAKVVVESFAGVEAANKELVGSLGEVKTRFDQVVPAAQRAGDEAEKAAREAGDEAEKTAKKTVTWRDRLAQVSSQGKSVLRFLTSTKALLAGGLGLVGVGLSVNALVGEFRSLVAELDSVANRAKALNLDPRDYLTMGFVAKQAGSDIELLAKALVKLDVASSVGNDALAELGVTLDGLNPQERFAAIAKAFDAIPNQADKTRLAVKLFGDELALRVLPLLKGNIEETAAEFERLGGTSIAAAVDDAERISDSFGRVSTAATGLKAALLDAFGPDIEAALDATAYYIANNRAEFVAFVEASAPYGESLVGTFSEIAGAVAAIGTAARLAFESTIFLLVSLRNEASKASASVARAFLYNDLANYNKTIDALKQELESRDKQIQQITDKINEAYRVGDQQFAEQLSGSLEKIKARAFQATNELKAATEARDRLFGDIQEVNAEAVVGAYRKEVDAIAESILSQKTVFEAYADAVEFFRTKLQELLATMRAVRAARVERPGEVAQPDDLAGITFEDDTAAEMLGPDPEVWREWQRAALDARRAVDEAVAGNEAAPLAEREAALRRIVEAEIEAERVRYESVLTEQELAQLAEARRQALDGQLATMREAAVLAGSNPFQGFAVGLAEAARSMTLATAGADFAMSVFTSLQQTAGEVFMGLIDGSVNAADAFKKFVQSVIQSLVALVAQMLVTIAVATLLNILFPGSTIALGAASNSLVNSGGGTLFDQFRSGSVTSGVGAGTNATIAPGAASPSQSLVQTNITTIQAVDAPSFQRLLARNSDSVAETVAGETNANFTLRSALGR